MRNGRYYARKPKHINPGDMIMLSHQNFKTNMKGMLLVIGKKLTIRYYGDFELKDYDITFLNSKGEVFIEKFEEDAVSCFDIHERLN